MATAQTIANDHYGVRITWRMDGACPDCGNTDGGHAKGCIWGNHFDEYIDEFHKRENQKRLYVIEPEDFGEKE